MNSGQVHIPQLVKSSDTEQIVRLVVLTEPVQVTAHVDHLIVFTITIVPRNHNRLVLSLFCFLIGELLGELLHLAADSLPLSFILFLYFEVDAEQLLADVVLDDRVEFVECLCEDFLCCFVHHVAHQLSHFGLVWLKLRGCKSAVVHAF